MNIVIDSNIFFSALIKDSITRKLILEYDKFFLFPEYIFEEMEKYKEELFKKSGMNAGDFDKLLHLLLQKVMIVPNEALSSYKEEALEILKDIDPNDAIFLACTLAYPDAILWSEDKRLKMQTKIKVLNTKEIKEFI